MEDSKTEEEVQYWLKDLAEIGEMSLRELQYRLKALEELDDLETRHRQADKLLLAFINCEPITREFLRHNAWYS